MEMFDWWEVRQRERVECSCVSMDDGDLCVIISGQWLMLMWSVHTSATIPLVRILCWSYSDLQAARTYPHAGSLNYSTSNTSEELAGPIIVDSVNCSGSEQRLIECNYDYLARRCTHAQDAAVFCQPGKLPFETFATLP